MTESSPHRGHRTTPSSTLEDFTMLEVDFRPPDKESKEGAVIVNEIDPVESSVIPRESLVVVAESDVIHGTGNHRRERLLSLSEIDFEFSKIKIRNWDRKTFYSDYIKTGLEYTQKKTENTIMLFESEDAKKNINRFKFLNWPPPKTNQISKSQGVLGPLRYSLMNGASLPAFYRHGELPPGLMEHWKETVPGFVEPSFVHEVSKDDTVYAYLPVEKQEHHVNDPAVHYHLAGKDAIHLMTQKTTRLLPDTKTSRPCVVKTTHSMGSKGIFIINNDEDEMEFEQFLREAGDPTFVVTDFVDIQRNVACHFFMHPDGERVVWFGSNENKRTPDGHFSSDSYLEMIDQESLKHMQLPFVEEVVQYCHSLGFWGFCGIDVLFDSKGNGHLVDINPRVTGSCPALMTLNVFHKLYGFDVGLFRRSGDINFHGTAEDLWTQVREYNEANDRKSRIVIHSMYQHDSEKCRLNIGVYGKEMEHCKEVLNRFAKPDREKAE